MTPPVLIDIQCPICRQLVHAACDGPARVRLRAHAEEHTSARCDGSGKVLPMPVMEAK